MPNVYGLGSCVRFPLAVGPGARRIGPPDLTLAVPARARHHLFLGFFLAGLSDPCAHRPPWHPPSKRLSASGRSLVWPHALLVCANAFVVFKRIADACRSLLDRDGGIVAAGFECMAARSSCGLLRMF